jgi:hypothetical protein
LEVQVQASCEKDGKNIDFSWLQLGSLASCSPSASSLTNWVTNLAQEQYIIFSAKIDKSNVFCQSDGGQKGQEVRLFTLLDESDKTHSEHGWICQFWAGVTYRGKTSAVVAEGTHHSFKKFGRPLKQISGCCGCYGNSGAGAPESYANSLNALSIWHHNMPPPTPADCTIYNPPFAQPFSSLLVLVVWKQGMPCSCSTPCSLYTRS